MGADRLDNRGGSLLNGLLSHLLSHERRMLFCPDVRPEAVDVSQREPGLEPGEDVDEIGSGVDSEVLATAYDGVEAGEPLGRLGGAAKQVIFPPNDWLLDLPLDAPCVELEATVVKAAQEELLLLLGVPQRFSEIARRSRELLLLEDPGEELVGD